MDLMLYAYRFQVGISVVNPAVTQGPCQCQLCASHVAQGAQVIIQCFHWRDPSLRGCYQTAKPDKSGASGEQRGDSHVPCQML